MSVPNGTVCAADYARPVDAVVGEVCSEATSGWTRRSVKINHLYFLCIYCSAISYLDHIYVLSHRNMLIGACVVYVVVGVHERVIVYSDVAVKQFISIFVRFPGT